tara:strand:- start:1046 stop:1288 length:243 start_codon:yes stop_codon:yes gene_type:complete
MKKSFETDITMHLTRISGDLESTKTDIAHIKDKVNTAVQHLELQNGRLRSAENSLAAHKAVGITMVTVLTLAISIVGLFK